RDGHKVKVTLTLRGREMHHPELSRKVLDEVVEAVEHVGKVEVFPHQDGRNMTMVLAPDRKAQADAERARKQQQQQAGDGGGDTPGGRPPGPGGRSCRAAADTVARSDAGRAPTDQPTDG